jgi:septum formation protein
MDSLILGSISPRRKEIMGYFDIPFEQVAPYFDEESAPFFGNPIDYVITLSKGKAQSLHQLHPKGLLLTADTIVFYNGKIFGKPKDPEEAFANLSELVGKWHSVYTGVTVMKDGKEFSQAEETKVLFNHLTPEQIQNYQKKLHLADKAGGYAIQMAGGLIVRKIEGCYYNVMGLPINTVRRLLTFFEIELWDHIK